MIQFITQPAPTIAPEIERALLEMSPRTFLKWDDHYALEPGTEYAPRYQGRWKIWCELVVNTHPDNKNVLSEGDKWNSEHQCWTRLLQTYKDYDGGFAPADERLITGLELADTWSDKFFAQKHLDDAWEAEEQAGEKARSDLYKDTGSYFRGHDNLIVGPHVNSGWRWRTR